MADNTAITLLPDDIIAYGAESGADAPKIADALQKWRDDVAGWAGENVPDPDTWWKGVQKLDIDTADALQKVQSQHIATSIEKALPDAKERETFQYELQASGFDLDSVPEEFKPAVDAYKSAQSDQTFRAPQRIINGKIQSGDKTLAYFDMTDSGEGDKTVGAKLKYQDGSVEKISIPNATTKDAKEAADEFQKQADENKKLAEQFRNQKPSAFSGAFDETAGYAQTASAEQFDAAAFEAQQQADFLKKNGRMGLISNRVKEMLKDPKRVDKVGQGLLAGLPGEFAKGLASASIDLGILNQRVQGDEAELRQLVAGKDELGTAIEGASRAEFAGNILEKGAATGTQSLGSMAPLIAGGMAARGLSGAAGRIAMDSGRLGVVGAGMGAEAAGSAYGEAEKLAQEAEKVGDTDRAARIRAGRDLYAITQAITETATERIGRLNTLKTSGHGVKSLLKDMIQEGPVEEGVAGLIEGGLTRPVSLAQQPDISQVPEAMVGGMVAAVPLAGTAQFLQKGYDGGTGTVEGEMPFNAPPPSPGAATQPPPPQTSNVPPPPAASAPPPVTPGFVAASTMASKFGGPGAAQQVAKAQALANSLQPPSVPTTTAPEAAAPLAIEEQSPLLLELKNAGVTEENATALLLGEKSIDEVVEAQPEVAPEIVTEVVRKKGGTSLPPLIKKLSGPTGDKTQPHIIHFLNRNPIEMPAQAKRVGKGEWDWLGKGKDRSLAFNWRNLIFKKGGMPIDTAIMQMKDAGYFPGIAEPTPEDLGAAIQAGVAQYEAAREQQLNPQPTRMETEEATHIEFANTVLVPSKGREEINLGDVAPGASFTVNGEPVTVDSFDDHDNVILKSAKWGTQTVPYTQSIYVDPAKGKASGEFVPPEVATPAAAVTKAKEDMFAGTDQDPFNLVGETAEERKAREAEEDRAARRKETAEKERARIEAEKAQTAFEFDAEEPSNDSETSNVEEFSFADDEARRRHQASGVRGGVHKARLSSIFAQESPSDESFDDLERNLTARYGSPPTGTPGQYHVPKYQTPDALLNHLKKMMAPGVMDYDGFLEAIKITDGAVRGPMTKSVFREAAKGEQWAQEMKDWLWHVQSGLVPPNAMKQPSSQPGMGQPPPTTAAAQAAAPVPPPTPPTPPPIPTRPTGKRTFNIPAMTLLSKMMGTVPAINRLLRPGTRGRFKGTRGTALDAKVELFEHALKDPKQAAKTLAHEIGHFIDYLPESLARVRTLAAKLAPLKNFKRIFTDLLKWSGNKMSPINHILRTEAVRVSTWHRGPFSTGDSYRNSANELYADFMSALLNDPEGTFDRAPNMSAAFFAALDQKPEVAKAYGLLTDLLTTDMLDEVLQEQSRKGTQDALKDAIAANEKREHERHSIAKAVMQAYQALYNRFGHTAGKAFEPSTIFGLRVPGSRLFKSLWSEGNEKEDAYTFTQQRNTVYYRGRLAVLGNDMQRDVARPLAAHGIANEDFASYLKFRRIINEDTRAGKWLRDNPNDARRLFKWMADEAGLSGWEPQIDAAADADLDALGAKLVGQLHEKGLFDAVHTAAQRSGAPAWAEDSLFAFDVSRYMLNPQGYTPEDSQRALDKMQKRMGAKWGAMEKIGKDFYAINEDLMREANDLGLFSDSLWNNRIEPNLGNYVPFAVLNYFTGSVDAGIVSRFGTAKMVLDPFLASQMKLASMVGRMAHQRKVMALRDFFDSHPALADEMKEHDGIVTASDRKEIAKNGHDTVGYWKKGKWTELEFTDPLVVQALGNIGADELSSVKNLLSKHSLVWQMPLTVLNATFQFFNTIRAVWSSLDYGFKGLKNLVWNAPGIAAEYAKSVGGDVMTPRVADLVRRGALPPPSESFSGMALTVDEMSRAIETGLIMAAVAPNAGAHLADVDVKFLKKLRDVSPPLFKVATGILRGLAISSGFVESISKVAAEQTNRERGASPQRAADLATLEGIPLPGISPAASGVASTLFLFWRVAMAGHRALAIKATAPETRARFLVNTAILTLGPAALWLTMSSGAMDAIIDAFGGGDDDKDKKQHDFEEMAKRANPYKRERGVRMPVGWVDKDGKFHPPWGHSDIPEDWTPLFLNMGESETSRTIQPFIHNVITAAAGSDIAPVDAPRRLAETGGNALIPGVVPGWKIVGNWSHVFDPDPPRDSFTGRDVVNKNEWNEGYNTRLWGMAKWTAGEGGQMFGMGPLFRKPRYDETSADWVKTMKRTPLLSRLVDADNWSGVREEQLIRKEEDRINATAQNMLPESAVRARNRYFHLQSKGNPETGGRRTDREQAEYDVLGDWYSQIYTGTEKKPGGIQILKNWAAGNKALDADYVKKILDETATDALNASKMNP